MHVRGYQGSRVRIRMAFSLRPARSRTIAAIVGRISRSPARGGEAERRESGAEWFAVVGENAARLGTSTTKVRSLCFIRFYLSFSRNEFSRWNPRESGS